MCKLCVCSSYDSFQLLILREDLLTLPFAKGVPFAVSQNNSEVLVFLTE